MNHLFVSYNLALQLKEKGFDELSQTAFVVRDDLSDYSKPGSVLEEPDEYPNWVNYNDYDSLCSRPLYQQVIDWFREKHNIEIDYLRYTYSGGIYKGKCYMWFVNQYDEKYNHELAEEDSHWVLNERKGQGYDFKNPYDALIEAIKEALKLI